MHSDLEDTAHSSHALSASFGFGRCDCHADAPRSAGRRLFTGLLGVGGAGGLVPAWAQEGVHAHDARGAAPERAGARQPSAGGPAARDRAAHHSVRRAVERPRAAVALGSEPAALPRAERLLHARRQDRFLLGHPAAVAAERRRGFAMIMGHEVAHALREHPRERMGKSAATNGAIELGAALFGLGNLGRGVANIGGQLLKLTFSREDESEADLVGMELAARAGYNPRAGISLWQKMGQASKGAPAAIPVHPPGRSDPHSRHRAHAAARRGALRARAEADATFRAHGRAAALMPPASDDRSRPPARRSSGTPMASALAAVAVARRPPPHLGPWRRDCLRPVVHDHASCSREAQMSKKVQSSGSDASASRPDDVAQVGAALDFASDAVILLRHDWRIAYVNVAFERGCGQSRETLLGREYWTVFPHLRHTRFETGAPRRPWPAARPMSMRSSARG
ncbi:peptidase family m48 domain-containing protein [Ditylenchus destructor]|nr:peptidase family m48 domain-containing protein [Ditylenchus destructor]